MRGDVIIIRKLINIFTTLFARFAIWVASSPIAESNVHTKRSPDERAYAKKRLFISPICASNAIITAAKPETHECHHTLEILSVWRLAVIRHTHNKNHMLHTRAHTRPRICVCTERNVEATLPVQSHTHTAKRL